MKVKKVQLEPFFKVLRGTDGVLSLADARVRDAFMKPLGNHLDAFYADRAKIYESFSIKDKEGNPDLTDGNFHFPADEMENLNGELIEFGEEIVEVEFVWGVTGGKLKEIIEKSTYKPVYGETEVIDEIINNIN